MRRNDPLIDWPTGFVRSLPLISAAVQCVIGGVFLAGVACEKSLEVTERTEQIPADAGFSVVEPGASEAANAATDVPPKSGERVEKTEGEWSKILPDLVFKVTRLGQTEPQFTGEMYRMTDPGRYQCVCCETVLFSSKDKYISETGWPTFTRPLAEDIIWTKEAAGAFRSRIAVECSVCDAHLGHLFSDGPPPEGNRYSINASALHFLADEPDP